MEYLILTLGVVIYALYKAIDYIKETYADEVADVINKALFGGILALLPFIVIILIEIVKISNPELISLENYFNILVVAFTTFIILFFIMNLYAFYKAIQELWTKSKYE